MMNCVESDVTITKPTHNMVKIQAAHINDQIHKNKHQQEFVHVRNPNNQRLGIDLDRPKPHLMQRIIRLKLYATRLNQNRSSKNLQRFYMHSAQKPNKTQTIRSKIQIPNKRNLFFKETLTIEVRERS